MLLDLGIVLVGGFLAFRAYRVNFFVGLVLSLLVLGIVLYRRLTALLMAYAMRLYTKGKKIKAMDWLERAYKIGMKPTEKVTYTYYLLREGRTGKCEEVLNQVLAFRSQNQEERNKIKSNHALLLMKTGRLYEAVEELEEIFPTYKTTSIYGSLGFCYLVQGDMNKALSFNTEAYEYNADDLVIKDNMMQTFAKLDRFEEAYEISKDLTGKNPAFREAYYDSAVIEYQLGKKEDAKKHLEQAKTIPTSFLTTVSDEIIEKLLDKIESGAEPEGSSMVFLEAKSASLPDAPTLRFRPNVPPVRRTEESAVPESDDPISFSEQSEKQSDQETAVEEDDGDGVFL